MGRVERVRRVRRGKGKRRGSGRGCERVTGVDDDDVGRGVTSYVVIGSGASSIPRYCGRDAAYCIAPNGGTTRVASLSRFLTLLV